jgi:hypothetical protein
MVSGITKSNLVVISDLDNTTLTGASPTPVSYKAKVRAVNTAGNVGAFSSASASATTQLIESQFIQDLTAAKITAGTIGAHEIVLTQSGAQTTITPPATTAIIRSSDYNGSYNPTTGVWTSGTAGWIIRGDGTAEFGAASIRDTLSANSIFINANNRWARNSTNSAGSSQFVVGNDDNQLSFDPTGGTPVSGVPKSLFKVGNNTNFIKVDNGNLTVTGAVTTNAQITSSTVGGVSVGASSIYITDPSTAAAYESASTGFYVDSTGRFSLRDKLRWNGNALTIAGDVTIGANQASTLITGANVAGNIGGSGITTISGDKISTGIIASAGNTRTINLTTGAINFGNFTVDAAGNATFSGTVTGSTITGGTIQNAASNQTFMVTPDGNVFANNIYATGSAGGTQPGLTIRSDGVGGAPASVGGSLYLFSATGTISENSSTHKVRIGSSSRYLEISYPRNPLTGANQREHVNVETTVAGQHLRLSSATGQIGLLGNTQTQRTQEAVTIAGDIILENYGPDAVAGGNNQGLPSNQQETRTVFSKNIGSSSSGTTCRIGLTDGLEYYGSPLSLRELKENIEDISGIEAINIVKSLRPRKFTWKPTSEDTELGAALKKLDLHYGFVAEEIKEAQPQLATYKMTSQFQNSWPNVTDEMFNDFPLIFYKDAEMPSIAISAIKNLIERVEFLEAQLAAQ